MRLAQRHFVQNDDLAPASIVQTEGKTMKVGRRSILRRHKTLQMICGSCRHRYDWLLESPGRAGLLFLLTGTVAFCFSKYGENDIQLVASVIFGVAAVWEVVDFIRMAIHPIEPRCPKCDSPHVMNINSPRGRALIAEETEHPQPPEHPEETNSSPRPTPTPTPTHTHAA